MKAEFKVREEDKNKGYIYFMIIRQSGEMPRYQSPSAIPFLLGHRDRVSDWVELQGSALTLSPSLVFAVSGRRDVDWKQTDCHILNNSETKTNTSAVCLCVCVCVCEQLERPVEPLMVGELSFCWGGRNTFRLFPKTAMYYRKSLGKLTPSERGKHTPHTVGFV